MSTLDRRCEDKDNMQSGGAEALARAPGRTRTWMRLWSSTQPSRCRPPGNGGASSVLPTQSWLYSSLRHTAQTLQMLATMYDVLHP